jgi:NitT/TauT family transport system substrate-binding protein
MTRLSNLLFAALAAALLLVGASVFAAAQNPKVRLILDFTMQGQQSPFLLAAEGGYFARAGVDVVVDRGYGSADAVTKVASGAYDFAFADLGAMIQFDGRQGEGKVVSVFQVYDIAPMVVLSLRKSGIKKPTDLAGKRIAAPQGSGSRAMFPLLAAANGLDMNSVKWIDVTPQLRETLLARGDAEATTAFITDVMGLQKLGIKSDDLAVMHYSDFGVVTYGNAIVTTPQFIERNPAAVKAVVAGFVEALKAAIANPDASVSAMRKVNSLQDDALERTRLEAIIKDAILTDEVRRNGLSSVTPARLQSTIDMVAKTFNTPPVHPESVYRADLLPPRDALMVPSR